MTPAARRRRGVAERRNPIPPGYRRRRGRVGVLEKRNPLPKGRYWIDALGTDAVEKLRAWFTEHSSTLRIVDQKATSEYNPVTDRSVQHLWVLFSVLEPTPWNVPIGWPNVATPEIKTVEDTVQRPPPEHMPDIFEAIAAPFEGLGIVLGLWLVYELTKSSR